MYFVKLNIVLSTCFCFSNGLSLNVFNFLLNEINELAAALDATTIFTKWMIQPLDHFNVLFRSSKVVVVGGSYAGNLAAWMKLLYPDLVDGAIASSGPVKAKADFYEYIDQVSHDFEEYGTSKCHDKITEIFQRYDKMFQTDAGIQQLKKEEQICDETDMTKWENRELFFLDKVSDFMGIAQYGDTDDVKDHCVSLSNSSRIISSKEGDTWNGKSQCFDYEFDSFIESIKSVDWYMAWIYQTCTEFGYYQTTAPQNQPFTDNISLGFYYKMCTATFGPDFNGKRVEKSVESTNKMYGGLTPNVTHVVFVNGDMDPWHRLGVLEDLSYDAPAKRIPRSSHCRDLFSNRQGDPEELKEARIYIKYLIKKWIGAGDSGNSKSLL